MDELSFTESRELLESLDVAHLGTAAEGQPYVTPISFVVIGDRVLFRTTPGRRLEAIRANPKVCIEASRSDDQGNWESVIVYGEAELVDDPQLEADVVAALLAKYHSSRESLFSFPAPTPFAKEPLVVAVPIHEITGRSSGRGFSTKIRPGRL